jgi:hypothetical protein
MALAAIAAGCGDAPPPAPRPPVRLTLVAPQDAATTHETSVQVAGNVAPASARVLVAGDLVAVRGGSFATTVDLREGPNVIDVGASAPGRRAVWRALRVTRHALVGVPRLVGREVDAAQATLEGLGLTVSVVVDDDLLDVFRRGPRLVCSTNPEPGVQLEPGAQVEIVVSKSC